MKKQKKLTKLEIEFKTENRSLTVSTDANGVGKILIISEKSTAEFQLTKEQINSLRLFLWDNHRRHNIWKTKAQRKAEGLIQVLHPTESSFQPQEINFEPVQINFEIKDLTELIN